MSLRSLLFKRSPLALGFALGALLPLLILSPDVYVAVQSRITPVETFPGQAHRPTDGALLVLSDPGGSVINRMVQIDQLDRANTPVEVLGICASACTGYLTLDSVCSGRASLWMFHSIYSSPDVSNIFAKAFGAHDPFLGALNRAWDRRFSPELALWKGTLRHSMGSGDEYWLTGGQLIDAGWVADCGVDNGSEALAQRHAARLSDGYVPPAPLPRAPWRTGG